MILCLAPQGLAQSTLQSLVDFIYSGEVSLDRANVQVMVDTVQVCTDTDGRVVRISSSLLT